MMSNDSQNIHFFHNNIPININKPLPIIKKITINMIQVLEGCSIPVEIERWIIQNETKIFEQEVLYINIPKSIDQGEMLILKDKGNSINEIIKGDIKIMIDMKDTSETIRRMGSEYTLFKMVASTKVHFGMIYSTAMVS